MNISSCFEKCMMKIYTLYNSYYNGIGFAGKAYYKPKWIFGYVVVNELLQMLNKWFDPDLENIKYMDIPVEVDNNNPFAVRLIVEIEELEGGGTDG